MIEPSLIKFLPEREQDRMRKLEKLFDSDGWKMVVEDWAKTQYEISKNSALGAKSWADNRVHTGRMTVYGDVLQLAERTAQEFEQIAEGNQLAAEEAAIDDELDYE